LPGGTGAGTQRRIGARRLGIERQDAAREQRQYAFFKSFSR
jgi:hypothetical protein